MRPQADTINRSELHTNARAREPNTSAIIASRHSPRRSEHRSATCTEKLTVPRRAVESAPELTDLIGREANLLDERTTGQITHPDDYLETHGTRANRWNTLVVPVLAAMTAKEIMIRTGKGKSAVYEARGGRSHPTPGEATRYVEAAVEWATRQLQAQGVRPPRDQWGLLYRYLRFSRQLPRCQTRSAY